MPRKKRKAEAEDVPIPVAPLVDPEGVFLQALGERIPPHSTEAEAAVLSAMMNSKEACRNACGRLEEADFYSEGHQVLFRCLGELWRKEKPVDSPGVQDMLGKDALDGLGGWSYLTHLEQAAYTSGQVAAHAKILRKLRVFREQVSAIRSYLLRPDEDQRISLVEALESAEEDGYAVLEANAMLREPEPVEWMIEPMIPLGGVTIIAGDPAVGKSWLALSLAHAVAHRDQKKWLGEFYIQRHGPVLYVDMEAGRPSMTDRMILMDNAFGTTPEPFDEDVERPLHFLFYAEGLTLGASINRLERVIRDRGIKLLILDSMLSMCPAWANPNNNSDLVRMIRPLRRMAARLGIAIVLIHHMKKGQAFSDNSPKARIMGGVMLVGEPDAAMAMIEVSDGDKAVIPVKARLARRVQLPFRVTFGPASERSTDSMHLLYGGIYEVGSAEARKCQEWLEEYLGEGPKMKGDCVDEGREVGDWSLSSVEHAMTTLVKQGKALRDKVGKASRWSVVK